MIQKMTKLEIYILLALAKVRKASALSINEISEKLQQKEKCYKRDNIYRKIVALQKQGITTEGAKDGKAKTYYLTDKGKEILENILNKGEIPDEY